MTPEATITETPVTMPLPPCMMRKAAAMMTAMTVGTRPKNRPQTEIRTERVSKKIPGSNCQGTSIMH